MHDPIDSFLYQPHHFFILFYLHVLFYLYHVVFLLFYSPRTSHAALRAGLRAGGRGFALAFLENTIETLPLEARRGEGRSERAVRTSSVPNTDRPYRRDGTDESDLSFHSFLVSPTNTSPPPMGRIGRRADEEGCWRGFVRSGGGAGNSPHRHLDQGGRYGGRETRQNPESRTLKFVCRPRHGPVVVIDPNGTSFVC